MKDHLSDVLFFIAIACVSASGWLARNAQAILFTLGFIAITIGFAQLDVSLGFIVPGGIVCGLIAWDAGRPPSKRNRLGEDSHD